MGKGKVGYRDLIVGGMKLKLAVIKLNITAISISNANVISYSHRNLID